MPLLRGKQTLLLPVNTLFVKISIIIAFFLNLLFGQVSLVVNFLDIVLIFWGLREKRIIQVGTGFVTGLVLDFFYGNVLGIHALTYTLICFLANQISLRFLSLNIKGQAIIFTAFVVLKNIILTLLIYFIMNKKVHLLIFWEPIVVGLLYPVIGFILLAPQLRPTSSEETPI